MKNTKLMKMMLYLNKNTVRPFLGSSTELHLNVIDKK